MAQAGSAARKVSGGRLAAIPGGLKSYVPGLAHYRDTGGTDTAAYSYAVWLRHRDLLARAGLPTAPPALVELGPGDSLGVGLAALMTGTRMYIALDVVPHVDVERNLAVLEERAALHRARAPISGDGAFPLLHPRLEHYAFPPDLAADAALGEGASETRVATLRGALRALRTGGDSPASA